MLTTLTCSLTSQMNNTLRQVFMLTCSLAKSPICCLIGCSLAHLGIYFNKYLLARSLNLDLKSLFKNIILLTCSVKLMLIILCSLAHSGWLLCKCLLARSLSYYLSKYSARSLAHSYLTAFCQGQLQLATPVGIGLRLALVRYGTVRYGTVRYGTVLFDKNHYYNYFANLLSVTYADYFVLARSFRMTFM